MHPIPWRMDCTKTLTSTDRQDDWSKTWIEAGRALHRRQSYHFSDEEGARSLVLRFPAYVFPLLMRNDPVPAAR